MPPKVKLGLIGTGHMGQYHVNITSSIAQYDLRGIFDNDEDQLTEVAGRFGVPTFDSYAQLLDEVEAIVIAVPTVMHYELALEALQAGRHVLVESP